MEMMDLPADLRRFARRQVLKRMIPCLALLIIFGTVLLLWGRRIFNTGENAFRYSGYIVIMLIPFALTGVPFKLSDRTYFGIVKDVELVSTVDNESSIWPTIEGAYRKNTVYLLVMLANGKHIRKKAFEGRANIIRPIEYYKRGDMVFHLYGSQHTVVLPKCTDDRVMCPVCGTPNLIEDDVCVSCRHTVIKEAKHEKQDD